MAKTGRPLMALSNSDVARPKVTEETPWTEPARH